jgi:glycosyltransferase involved in cell wall biosynthesis
VATDPPRLRIALVSPPFLQLPPPGYAGTERIVTALALGLHERGHRVTVFAPGDSDLPCEVVPTVEHALWRDGDPGDATGWLQMTSVKAIDAADRFDVIHSHLDADGLLIARGTSTPFVATLHGRLDTSGVSELIKAMPDVHLISISDSQRRWNEDANWVATIHHGLDFSAAPVSDAPGDYLLLVGRVMPEKGIAEAIEVARHTGIRLVMAAKVKHPDEQALFREVVQPAIDDGVVDWRGEIGAEERDGLMAGALATLMLGSWPEPFGLVAIESMATGTPVIGRRAGALVETVRHGTTGFLVDDVREAVLAVSRVKGLDRRPIAAYARSRFSVERMLDEHERVYEKLVAGRPAALVRDAQPTVQRPTPVTTTVRSRRAGQHPQPLAGLDGRAGRPASSDGAAVRTPASPPMTRRREPYDRLSRRPPPA